MANEEELSVEQQQALLSVNAGGLQKKLNEEAWTDHMEDLLKAWGEKAAGLRWMHNKASGSWKQFSNKLSIPIIVFTTLAGVANFGASGSEDPAMSMYVIGGVNIIAGMLASFHKFYQPDEKSQLHATIAKQFGTFYRHLTMELNMGRADRTPVEELTRWSKLEYDRLQLDAPPLGGAVIAAYKKEFEGTDNMPDVAEDNFDIRVFGRTASTMSASNLENA